MQPGSLTPSSSTKLYSSAPPGMSNFFGTLIAILTIALPIILISQNSTLAPSIPSNASAPPPESANKLSSTAIVPPQSIHPPHP
jgi:hypothetical protein